MGIPIFLVLLDLVSLGAALGFTYYATRLFLHMRWGRLERSWKLMMEGAIIFSLGFVSLTIQDLSPVLGNLYIISDYFGGILSTAGIILLLLGLRAHYAVWALKNVPKKTSTDDLSVPDDRERKGSSLTP